MNNAFGFLAVIFDLDGVLVATDDFHYKSWKQIADQENIYFDEIINTRMRGTSRMSSLEILLERAEKTYTLREKYQLAEKKNDIFRAYLMKTLNADYVRPEILNMLITLKERGYKLAVASSSRNANLILMKCRLIDYFDTVVDGTMINVGRPHPEAFMRTALFLKVEPSQALIVEDAPSGVEAGKNGGFKVAGIGHAFHHPKADWSLRSIDDLLTILG